MDDDKIIVSGKFLDSFLNDLEEAYKKLGKCVHCDFCDSDCDCPLVELSVLLNKLYCIVSGDVNEWD